MSDALQRIEAWFSGSGFTPFDFQREAWRASRAGEQGLIHAPTGTGKTFAALFGPLSIALDAPREPAPEPDDETVRGPRLLWITPVRALANDLVRALAKPVQDLEPDWRVEARTGDVSASVKQRQKRRPPEVLVTTPESLTLMLTWDNWREHFDRLDAVVVDEWHELLGSKRGVQLELALARLRGARPTLSTWGVSATIGNLEAALKILVGTAPKRPARVHSAPYPKELAIETLLPPNEGRLPFGGHLGLDLLGGVLERIAGLGAGRSALLFTNTRAQAERWFQELLAARPDWAGELGLHHGSLEGGVRRFVEQRLAAGTLRACVATSSLDLGVDFQSVDLVVQIGSPKGTARLLQRAGRSGHRPGEVSRVLGVPTNALEVLEFAAARRALEQRRLEQRASGGLALDVLCQHLVTCSMGRGFQADELLAEVRTTHAFRRLSDAQWRFAMDFVTFGGATLQAYDRYARVADRRGRWRIRNARCARQHRLSIGTITSDFQVQVAFQRGRSLGTVEENFAARLTAGDRFQFAGRVLEFVGLRDLRCIVCVPKKAKAGVHTVPRWMGGRMPLSSELAATVLELLDGAAAGLFDGPELRYLRPLLELQQRQSGLPSSAELLIESTETDQGHHVFCYPLAGRHAHEGLSTLVAWRLARETPLSLATYCNDHGFQISCRKPLGLEAADWRQLLSVQDLERDLLKALGGFELARRRFRSVARVAGLIFEGFPGVPRTAKSLHQSSALLFDTLQAHEPEHLLLAQAKHEVLEAELEIERLSNALERIAAQPLRVRSTDRLTPFGVSLWAEQIRERMTTESFSDRFDAMVAELERAARGAAPAT